MITDTIENANLYFGLGNNFIKAFEYLKNTNFLNVENGKYEIDGKNVIAIVNSYNTKPINEGSFEAHTVYTDIQFIVNGIERLYYTNIKNTKTTIAYNAEKDIAFMESTSNTNFVTATNGQFVIFYPTDAHMPNILELESTLVKKVVMKVL